MDDRLFSQIFELRGAIYERARNSEVVAEFVASLDDAVATMLGEALAQYVPPEYLPLAVQTFRAAIAGAFLHGLTRKKRHQVITFAFEHLTNPAGPLAR